MFADREDAARKLAQDPKLARFISRKEVIVLGIPRGGVAVAAVLARALHLPVGVLIARKIGAPGNPEYAIGAVAGSGPAVWNKEAVGLIDDSTRRRLAEETTEEVRRRTARFGKTPDLVGKIVLLVDDGLATGLTMEAACLAARSAGAASVIVACPVASLDAVELLKKVADEVIVLATPPVFAAVGQFYEHFPQIEDEEVAALLGDGRR
jgi:putative phosphoribosyl transferase